MKCAYFKLQISASNQHASFLSVNLFKNNTLYMSRMSETIIHCLFNKSMNLLLICRSLIKVLLVISLIIPPILDITQKQLIKLITIYIFHLRHHLWHYYFKVRNFRCQKLSQFRVFWPFPRKLIPRNVSKYFIRESLFPRNFSLFSNFSNFSFFRIFFRQYIFGNINYSIIWRSMNFLSTVIEIDWK